MPLAPFAAAQVEAVVACPDIDPPPCDPEPVAEPECVPSGCSGVSYDFLRSCGSATHMHTFEKT